MAPDSEATIDSTSTSGDMHGGTALRMRGDDALLATLGYKSEFRREFSAIETVAFAFSIMGVCAAVSTTFAFPLAAGGHVGMVWGWIVPGPLVLCIAAGLAELTSSMPTSAGLYYFSAKMAPPEYSALASWITAWANITGQITLVCSIDFTCAQLITTAVAVQSDGAIVLSAGATFGILLAILFMHGVVCSAATQLLARLNLLFVATNLGTAAAMVISLLVASGENRVSAKDAFTLFENNTGWLDKGWVFLLAFIAPMWTLTGYDASAHISEEVAGAAHTAPIAILSGVGGTIIIGWMILISASFATTSVPDVLATKLPLPMGQLLLDTLGKRGMLTIWSFIFIVQFGNGITQGVDASRVVYAFARDNALPGSRLWKRINRHTQTPVNAVWLVMSASAVCGVLGFSNAALTSLAGATVIGLYTSYAIPILLRITSGRARFVPGPFALGRWAVPVGAIGVAWAAFVNVLLVFPTAGPSLLTAETMNYAVVIIAAVFLLAAGTWFMGANKWFTGPVPNIDGDVGSMSGETQDTKDQ